MKFAAAMIRKGPEVACSADVRSPHQRPTISPSAATPQGVLYSSALASNSTTAPSSMA